LIEVIALSRCRHVNVIRYREAFQADAPDTGSPLLCIVMQYADAGQSVSFLLPSGSSVKSFFGNLA